MDIAKGEIGNSLIIKAKLRLMIMVVNSLVSTGKKNLRTTDHGSKNGASAFY